LLAIIIFLNLVVNVSVPNAYFLLPKSQVGISFSPYTLTETVDCAVVIDGISIGGNRWVSFDDFLSQDLVGERVADDYIIKGCESSNFRFAGKIYNEVIFDGRIAPDGGEIIIELSNKQKITRLIEASDEDVIVQEEITLSGLLKFLVENLPNIIFSICFSYILLVVLLLARIYVIFDFLFLKNHIFSDKNQPEVTTHHGEKSNQILIVLVICIILSTLSILFTSASSPLYPINTSVDNNTFFTLGKGMMRGKVPYRDLYENNGPYIHLLFGIAYLISNTTFVGVYILEVLFFSVFLFISYKLALLFVDSDHALILLPAVAFFTVNLISFAGGGHVEEFCLPLLIFSLYHLIKYLTNIYPNPFPKKWFLINGAIAGCVLWAKYSLLGFWFGWMASLFFILVSMREYKKAFDGAFIFLFGMVLATIPWIIYFGLNNSIGNWLNVYILNTFLYYRKNWTFLQIFSYTLRELRQIFTLHPVYFSIMLSGLGMFSFSAHLIKNLLHRASISICAVLLIAGVFGGGRGHWYSSLIFSPYFIFGLITLLVLIGKFGRINRKRVSVILVFIITLSASIYTFYQFPNPYLTGLNKEDTAQYQYAAIINQADNPTLLNYDCLDGGFYTVTGILPNVRFFMSYNFSHSQFPELMNEQNRYLEEKLVDYVVIYLPPDDNNKDFPYPNLLQNYELVEVEDRTTGYLLFRNKEIPD